MVCSCPISSNCVWLQIIFCSSFLRSFLGEKKQIASLPEDIHLEKKTWRSNDKTIIKLGYRKISWFVSVSQINYLPQPSAFANDWSARRWQITIFCSTSSNNCWLFVERSKDHFSLINLFVSKKILFFFVCCDKSQGSRKQPAGENWCQFLQKSHFSQVPVSISRLSSDVSNLLLRSWNSKKHMRNNLSWS